MIKISTNQGITRALCLMFALSPSFLFAQAKMKVTTVNSFEKNLSASSNAKTSTHSLITPDGSLNVKFNVQSGSTSIGSVTDSKTGTVQITSSKGMITGKIILPEKKKAYEYSTSGGDVYVEEKNIESVLCVEYHKYTGQALRTSTSSNAVPDLQSLPGAQAVVLLDFDGQTVSGTLWNGGNTIVAAPATQSDSERVEIWKLISEDFRPFKLNVTTSEAVYQAAPANRRMRCIFTPTDDAAPGWGGVAFIGSFSWGNDTPCWAFNGGIIGGGEVGSHEIGHTLGLIHDGRTNPAEEYYAGQGNWAPIMGVGYYRSLVQWSKGEYTNANNQEDDIAIIASATNGFGYRVDDVGSTAATSKALNIDPSGTLLTNEGLIERRADVDVYSFTTTGGMITLDILSNAAYPNLDIIAKVKNPAGITLATSNPDNTLNASINVALKAGSYFLYVDGTGMGDPLTDGYSDYASEGTYGISGTVPGGGNGNTPPTVTLTNPPDNTTYTIGATIELTATASDANGTVTKVSFYDGSTLLGTDFTAPYSLTLTNVQQGIYVYKAVATDNEAASATSNKANVTVGNPIGINGPSCLQPNVPYQYVLVPDANGVVHVSWWVDAEAQITVDSLDSKKATFVFTPNSVGTRTITAGVDFSGPPWYRSYTKTVNIGNCSTASVLRVIPEPAQESSLITLEDNEDNIVAIQIFDRLGREVQRLENINSGSIELGSNLAFGIYTIKVVTEKTFYVRNFMKQ